MPRSSVAHAASTRARIVDEAVQVASVTGLEGLTIGGLAERLDLSKSGLIGHFGSKERLQLVTLEEAIRIFRATVWEPVAETEPGRARLLALCERWLAFNASGRLPGGCFITTVSVEFDGRPGPVRDLLQRAVRRWAELLEQDVARAQAHDEIAATGDPAQIAFEINALVTAANMSFQLHRDPAAHTHARNALERLLAPA